MQSSTDTNNINRTGENANFDNALKNFILDKLSDCTEIQCIKKFLTDFGSAFPVHAKTYKSAFPRLRKLLDNINHEDYDDAMLARMMFCFGQPLVGRNLEELRKRLDENGELRVDWKKRINFFKNDDVKLEGEHKNNNRWDRNRGEGARSESLNGQMEKEARENEDQENVMKEEPENVQNEIVQVKEEIVEPATKKAKLEALDVPGIYEETFDYFSFLNSIRAYSIVIGEVTFESLITEIDGELRNPQNVGKKVVQSKVAEAFEYGVSIAMKHAKQATQEPENSIGLVEFLRFLAFQLISVQYSNTSGTVVEIKTIIDGSSSDMIIPIAKVKFALENIFEKIS